MNLAIDTNAYRAFLDGEKRCVEMFREAKSIAVPVVVLGELRASFAYGNQPLQNEAILARILSSNRLRVLEVGEATSHLYAAVWASLRKKRKPIPTDDIWIAAQCIKADVTLLTRDHHFDNVDVLRTLNWSRP
jgi:predicted nucleic acid-binding protein